MLQQFLPEPDIIPEQLEDLVAAGDPGKDPLRVRVEKIFRRQVCGNDRGFPAHEPLIDEQEQLGGDEGVHHLRAQIINDEQVTVEDVIPEIIVLFFTGKAVPGKTVKQLSLIHILPDELIDKVLEAGLWAAHGCNVQSIRYIVVREKNEPGLFRGSDVPGGPVHLIVLQDMRCYRANSFTPVRNQLLDAGAAGQNMVDVYKRQG